MRTPPAMASAAAATMTAADSRVVRALQKRSVTATSTVGTYAWARKPALLGRAGSDPALPLIAHLEGASWA